MKKILLLILVASFAVFTHAQIVNIPDATLKATLVGTPSINTNSDSEIQVSEATAYSGALNIAYSGAADLTGLEAFVNLTELDCRGLSLTSIDVSSNVALIDLAVRNNDLTTIDLSNNTQLVKFSGGLNDFATVDFTNNVLLENISLEVMNLQSIDVSMLPNLKTINVYNNDLTTLDLGSNDSLTYLNAGRNDIDDFTIGNKPVLEYYDVRSNELDSIDLSTCPNVITLYIQSNNLTSVDLSNLPLLDLFNAGYNNITSFDFSLNPLMVDCDIENNEFPFISFANNPLIEELIISNNDMVSLDVSVLPNLKEIYMLSCFNLVALNMANGNNTNITVQDFRFCWSLTCIEVDDVAYANANFTQKEATTSYSIDCNYCIDELSIVDTSICEGEVYINSLGAGLNTSGQYYDTLQTTCGSDSILQIDLSVLNVDTTVLPDIVICEGDTVDFYGTSITVPGTNTHTIMAFNGCDSIIQQSFIPSTINPEILRSGMTLSTTDTFDTYQWYRNNQIISNETSSELIISTNGAYSLLVGNAGCNKFSNSILVDDLETGIRGIAAVSGSVYPNPTKDLLYFDNFEESILTVAVFDLQGRLIKSYEKVNGSINVSNVDSGFFTVLVTTSKGQRSFKLYKN